MQFLYQAGEFQFCTLQTGLDGFTSQAFNLEPMPERDTTSFCDREDARHHLSVVLEQSGFWQALDEQRPI